MSVVNTIIWELPPATPVVYGIGTLRSIYLDSPSPRQTAEDELELSKPEQILIQSNRIYRTERVAPEFKGGQASTCHPTINHRCVRQKRPVPSACFDRLGRQPRAASVVDYLSYDSATPVNSGRNTGHTAR